MTNVEIVFNYNGINIIIKCGKHEKFKEICKNFRRQTKTEGKPLFFIYSGSQISNDELSFKELANYDDRKRKKMNILVNDIEDTESSQSQYFIKSKEIICPECKESTKFKIENYNIILYECKNKHETDLLFDEFDKSQNINISKIFCQKCNNNKGNIYNNSFYKCNICNINLCPICNSKHDKNHNVINYDNKNYICEEHNKGYESYCEDCKKNLCKKCELNNHSKHKIKRFCSLNPDDMSLKNYIKKLKEKIKKLKYQIREIINKLNKVIDNFDIYYNISKNILNNFNKENINYEILYNINNISNNPILQEINDIINDKNIKNKFKKIIDIYDKMISGKSISIIYKIYNDMEETNIFGEQFVKNNKNNCTILIDGKEYKLSSSLKTKHLNKNELIIKLKGIQNITDASYMFNNCFSLSSPDISKWNTSKITNMCYMWSCNSLLPFPDLSNWNTSNVTNMAGLFTNHGGKYLPDISNWDTSNVTNMKYLFYNCRMITSLPDISEWDTSKVTDMSYMFYSEFIKDLPDLSKWNTEKVTNMSNMFKFCGSLVSLPDISKWNTSKVTKMNEIFKYCTSLVSLPDISKWDTHKVNDMSEMFFNCFELKSLPDISKWNTEKVTNMREMFTNCNNLISFPDLSKWNTSHLDENKNMFNGCNKVKEIPVVKKKK